ncbi:MAG: 50S ribosome-binding GTPase, partial [bacterium]|nr:50S ribosome-binding GTPase [bacterium]
MSNNLNETPSANRLHIGFFGKRNSGKSSLINAFTGQGVSIVSDVAGTTTDPVYKPMELNGIGACVLIDTAGFDDEGELGKIRVEKTRLAAEKTDVAVIVFSDMNIEQELYWYNSFKSKKTPVIAVINTADIIDDKDALMELIKKETKQTPLVV